MYDMNWVDYVIIAIFFLSALTGLSRGLVREIISLASLVAGLVVASIFASPLASAFTNTHDVQTVVNQTSTAIGVSTAAPVSYAAIGLSFGLLFAGTVIVGAIIGFIINFALQSGVLGLGNRLLGGIFGICRGFIINLVLIFLVQLTSFGTDDIWKKSQLVDYFQPAVIWLGDLVAPGIEILKTKMENSLGDVTTNIQSITQPSQKK